MLVLTDGEHFVLDYLGGLGRGGWARYGEVKGFDLDVLLSAGLAEMEEDGPGLEFHRVRLSEAGVRKWHEVGAWAPKRRQGRLL